MIILKKFSKWHKEISMQQQLKKQHYRLEDRTGHNKISTESEKLLNVSKHNWKNVVAVYTHIAAYGGTLTEIPWPSTSAYHIYVTAINLPFYYFIFTCRHIQ